MNQSTSFSNGFASKNLGTSSSLDVKVEGSIYERVLWASSRMACGQKRSQYGRGCINNENDPFRVQRIGLLGEAAFSLWSGISLDLSYKPKGDNCDFLIRGHTLDVKCASRNYRMNLIVSCEVNGGKKHNLKDIYVGSYLIYDFPEHWAACVRLLGYNLRDEILKVPVTPSSRGVHINHRLLHEDLRSLHQLKDFISGKLCYASI